MSPARVSITLPGGEERTLDTSVGFLVMNEDGRYVMGCMCAPSLFASILREAAEEIERRG